MTRDDKVRSKIERLQAGAAPRVLDLFAGCGGMTLGFVRAGFESLGGIETDRDAIRTFAHNFHRGNEQHSEARDVRGAIDLQLADLGHDDPGASVDIIVGGPPCPTYSKLGRAKLNLPRTSEEFTEPPVHQPELFNASRRRRVRDARDRDIDRYLRDERNQLYDVFLKWVDVLHPLAVVMENVPGFLNQGGRNHGEVAARTLHDLGYESVYTLLNAAAYGVPQWRERFFLISFHRDLGIEKPAFPTPTRNMNAGVLPRGILMNRKAALIRVPAGPHVHVDQLTFWKNDHWIPAPQAPDGAPGPVTTEEALSDLPDYESRTDVALTRRYESWVAEGKVPYSASSGEPYPVAMRSWPGFEAGQGIAEHHHLTRHTTVDSQRDVRIFGKMKPGDEFPEAIRIALDLFEEEKGRKERSSGEPLTPDEYDALKSEYVPPYDDSKFPNKWWRLIPDAPSRVLTAHMSKDTYSHIHHEHARMITIQEAARLQSFPDGFVFRASMNGAFRQIGNSVPPLLAWSIGSCVLEQLRTAVNAIPAIDPSVMRARSTRPSRR